MSNVTAIPVPDRKTFLVEQIDDTHTVTTIPGFGGWGTWYEVWDVTKGRTIGGANRRHLVPALIARTAA
jgi:hypothetical protein